jgi:hypothetical protein
VQPPAALGPPAVEAAPAAPSPRCEQADQGRRVRRQPRCAGLPSHPQLRRPARLAERRATARWLAERRALTPLDGLRGRAAGLRPRCHAAGLHVGGHGDGRQGRRHLPRLPGGAQQQRVQAPGQHAAALLQPRRGGQQRAGTEQQR